MAFQRPFLIILKRDDPREAWGFKISGGADLGTTPTVQKVVEGGIAAHQGLHEGDLLIQIGTHNVEDLTEARINSILAQTNSKKLEIFIVREDFLQKPRRGEPATVKAVVHNQYNSPLHLYSQEKVAETLALTAQALTQENGVSENHTAGLPPGIIRSAVLQAVNEEESAYRPANATIAAPRKGAPSHPLAIPPPHFARAEPSTPGSTPRTPVYQTHTPQSPYQQQVSQPSFYQQQQQQHYQTQYSRQESYPLVDQQHRTHQIQEAELRQRLYEEERQKQAEFEEQRFRQLQERRLVPEESEEEIQWKKERQRAIQQEEERRRKAQLYQEEQLENLRRREEEQRKRAEEQRRLEEQRRFEEQRRAEEQRRLEQQRRAEEQRKQEAYRRWQEEQQRAQQVQQARQQQYQQQQYQQHQAAPQQYRPLETQQQQRRPPHQPQQHPVQRQWSSEQRGPVPTSPQHQEQVGRQAREYENKIRETRMSFSPQGSPATRRRDTAWPPKESSVRWVPKTGFSPQFSRQSSRDSKRFVWPPPPEYPEADVANKPPSRIAGNAWHPKSPTAASRTPPFARSPSLGRKNIAWPPPQPEPAAKMVPKPVARGLHDPQEYLRQHASVSVPVTYRPPPNTSHYQNH